MEIKTIKALIDSALADGKLTRLEMDRIYTAITMDHKVTGDELRLVREIQEKVSRGEIEIVEDPEQPEASS